MKFNQDQIDSLVRSAAKIAGGILAAHGLNDMATAVNTPDTIKAVAGIVMASTAAWASHKSNASTIVVPSQPPVLSQPPKP
jgi:predicted alpha/beta hydrolase family esterase